MEVKLKLVSGPSRRSRTGVEMHKSPRHVSYHSIPYLVLVCLLVLLTHLSSHRCDVIEWRNFTRSSDKSQLEFGYEPPEWTENELNLEHQALESVPTLRLCHHSNSTVTRLNVISLAHNRIRRLESNAFVCVASSLKILILKHNEIESISSDSFAQLDRVRILSLSNNRLVQILSHETLRPLKSLRHLNLANNRIESLASEAFERSEVSSGLISLNLNGNPLNQMARDSLVHLSGLKTLSMSENLIGNSSHHLEPLEGLSELRFLYLDRGKKVSNGSRGITSVSNDICLYSRKLTSLVLKSNQLSRVPQFSQCQNLLLLDLSYNQIGAQLEDHQFLKQPNLIDLYLGHNKLEFIHERAFVGLNSLQVLELDHNRLTSIHKRAFAPVRFTLQHLSLANNKRLKQISPIGLDRLISFKSNGNPELRQLPRFRSARSLTLTFAYDCCEYLDQENEQVRSNASGWLDVLLAWLPFEVIPDVAANDESSSVALSELVVWPEPRMPESEGSRKMIEREQVMTTRPLERRGIVESNLMDEPRWEIGSLARSHDVHSTRNMNLDGDKTRAKLHPDRHSIWLDIEQDSRHALNELEVAKGVAIPMELRPMDLDRSRRHFENREQRTKPLRRHVECLPKPSAFLPCRDLFDSWWLRFGIWLVFPCALVGNVLVIVVLSSAKHSSSSSALTSIMWLAHSKRHIDVPRFLVINLAVADLLMALYLGVLALVDLSTLGRFKLFAIKWQYSKGCQIAGFFAVLSSELSVFILAIITLERNYAITNAVHLNRRLSLQKASIIMIVGYTFAILMASLPLNGINDYRKFSICLPMDLDSSVWSQTYVVILLTMNSLGFIMLLGCYLRMYFAIRGSQAWNTNDLRIAKRMSILVLTDFLCWMPIILVSVASLFGRYLLDTTGLKVMTIFVLPLNSVANPFLYAITTKRFQRDLNALLSRVWSVICFRKYRDDQSSPVHFNQDPGNVFIYCQRKHQLKQRGAQVHVYSNRRTRLQHSDGLECHRHTNQFNAQTQNQVTMNKTSCYSSRQQVPTRLDDATQINPRIILQSNFPDTSELDEARSQESQSEKSRCLNQTKVTSNESSHRSVSSMIRLVAPDDMRRAQSVRNSVLRMESNSGDEYCRAGSLRIHPNYEGSSQKDLDQYLSVAFEPKTICESHDTSILSINEARCVSAGANYSSRGMIATTFGSDDPMNSRSARSRSPLTRRIIFSPIVKAWSSLQISLRARSSLSGCSLLQTRPTSSVLNEQIDSPSKVSTNDDRLDPYIYGLLPLDAISPQSSPLRDYRRGERRMSRSCETMSTQMSPHHSSKCTIGQYRTPTSSNTVPTSQFDCDDKKVLLSNMNQMSGRRGQPGAQCELNLMGNPSRSTRCRSWSPALLGRLEDCINQIRSRLPRLSPSPRQNRQIDTDFVSSGESHKFCPDDVIQTNEEDGDIFNESELTKFRQKNYRSVPRIQAVRSWQQQSSINSDTSRGTIGTTTVTTTLDSSFSESSSNIPFAINGRESEAGGETTD